MTDAPPVSVVVVSHGRPDALARCLTGLTRLTYPDFEIVVVADGPGLHRLDQLPALFDRIKTHRFDHPNISHARNFGIALAAGRIVAFLDDDAVPEPLWLDHLAAPFDDDRVMSVGGYVIGRNGITLQWGPRCIQATGRSDEIEGNGDAPALFSGRPGLGIKTEGTNMAFRRDALAGMGGFDPAFRFYLDEADVNLRLAEKEYAAALVPLARVHHGFAASPRRRPDRVPRDLREVGASLSVFLRKHLEPGAHSAAVASERAARRRALLDHMVAGRIEPRDVDRILATFDQGLEEGRTRPVNPLVPLPAPTLPYKPFAPEDRTWTGHRCVFGRIWSRRRVLRQARALAQTGATVTAMVLSPTARPHRVSFTEGGFWLHRGGRFGRSRREDRLFRHYRLKSRVMRELRLVEPVRGPAEGT